MVKDPLRDGEVQEPYRPQPDLQGAWQRQKGGICIYVYIYISLSLCVYIYIYIIWGRF